MMICPECGSKETGWYGYTQDRRGDCLRHRRERMNVAKCHDCGEAWHYPKSGKTRFTKIVLVEGK